MTGREGIDMNRISSIFFCTAIGFTVLAATPAARADSASAQAALDRLKSLAGKWQGTSASDPNSTMQVQYKVTAGGSTVVETEFEGMPHEMVSVFHLDGEHLVMTHYCATGNQPRLRLDPMRSSDDELFFDFVSGSNMDPAKDVHIHTGRFRWDGDNAIESEWVAYKDGRPDHTAKFSLKRLSN
jgi:hypothetical protein